MSSVAKSSRTGMSSWATRKSHSFSILANNSPGDGDSVFTAADDETIVDERVESKQRRRRRRMKSRRLSAGDLSPLSLGDDELLSVSPSPLTNVRGNRMPTPLQSSLSVLGRNSSQFSPDWREEDLPSSSSSYFPPFSPDVSRASGRGGLVQGEFRSKMPSVSRIEESPAGSSHEIESILEHMQSLGRNGENEPRGTSGAPSKVHGDSELRSPGISVRSPAPAFGDRQADLSETDEKFSKTSQLPPKAPDFSAASEGLAEPAFAPGGLHPPTELRQRNVDRNSDKEGEKSSTEAPHGERKLRSRAGTNPSFSADEHATPTSTKIKLGSFTTPQLKDWERIIASQAHYPPPLALSPMQYLVTELCSGSTLRNTTSVGTDQKRERVYNTMFHVPWRCELLIDVGFFVCLDAFLSLFTVMPARITMFSWQRLVGFIKGRQPERLFAAELSDFGCLIVLVVGVVVLMQADISIIYHWIRGQGVIKLYVVFNVLEIFDKLCQSFGADVLQVLFNSAESVECCRSERIFKEMARYAFDLCIAIFAFFVHSLVIISQAITISAAVNAQNNALLTLLISNNFAEIKSNVFKRMGTDQLHKMAYHDTVERFHIMTHVLFVWAQNVLNGDESLWRKFFYNAGMVFFCEVLVDVIKHSFLAKFNEVKPAAYSEFLQALCSQTLNSQSHEVHKTLTFVPLAPAVVVMRILLPVYAACILEGPIWWRWPSMLVLAGLTYLALVAVKVAVGLGLQFHAKWYLKRHPWTPPHLHYE